MRRLFVVAGSAVAALSALMLATLASGAPVAACPAGAVKALIGGKHMCLREEQKCATRLDVQYSRYGFACTAERLTPRSRWTMTVLPGSNTFAEAINEHGQIVGRFGQVGTTGYSHAFLWQNGVMLDLGTLGGVVSDATAVNNHGQVVGNSTTATGETHAFLWQNGEMTDLGTLGGPNAFAVAINDQGQVIGYGTAVAGSLAYGFLWENGVMTDLGNFVPIAINDLGQVVGRVSAGDGNRSDDNDHSALRQAGVMTDLGGRGILATAINQRGQVTGSRRTPTIEHAFLWEDGVLHDLGPLGAVTGRARAINNRGQAVGAILSTTGWPHAVLWNSGRIEDLGTLSPRLRYSSAVAINDQGLIIGRSYGAGRYGRRAFVWQNGRMRDLGSLGGLYTDVRAINNRGDIIGLSSSPTRPRAVLWTLRRGG